MMNEECIIEVKNINKTFRLPHEKNNSIKTLIINPFKSNRKIENQHVLDNISFDVKKGEFFGIVGRNGSGKSTLLKLLAGIYSPTKGSIKINGKLTPFIELGVGFSPELTGRENVYLNGALLGFSRKEMNAMYDEIVEFSELTRFMDQKLKNYSSGMQVRLAFSIAIRSKTDILLIDEVLAVGDAAFQQKCYKHFLQLKKEKRTVVFISHDMGAIKRFCDRSIAIESGKIACEGDNLKVTNFYDNLLLKQSESTKSEARHAGTDDLEISDVKILDKNRKPTKTISSKDPFTIKFKYKNISNIGKCIFGIGIIDEKDQNVIGPNTKKSLNKAIPISSKGEVSCNLSATNLTNGVYTVVINAQNPSETISYDLLLNASVFTISDNEGHSVVSNDCRWEIS